MKKQLLIFLSIIFFTVLAKSCYVNFFFHRYHHPIAQIFKYKLQMAHGLASSQGAGNIVILGDSKVLRAVDASQIERGISLASVGATPKEMHYLFKTFLQHNPSPEIALISFSYQISMKNRMFFWQEYVYHGFYTSKHLAEIREQAYQHKEFPAENLLQYYLFPIKAWLYQLKILPINLTLLQRSILKPYQEIQHNYLVEKLKERQGSLLANKTKENKQLTAEVYDFSKLQQSGLNDYYLKQILDLCDQYSISCRFFYPPHKESTMALPYFLEQQKHFDQLLTTNHKSSQIRELLAYPDHFFADDFHLNKEGSIIFSKRLENVIKKVK